MQAFRKVTRRDLVTYAIVTIVVCIIVLAILAILGPMMGTVTSNIIIDL